MKSHAKDYLMEICAADTTEDWLKALIMQVIINNGMVDKTVLDKIYDAFKCGSAIEIPQICNTISPKSALVRIKKLQHVSGVCALKEKQCIVFSPSLTILYGLNGSGKSSYFRILNELVGGSETKKIIPNIFVDSPSSVNVSLEYDVDGRPRQVIWDGSTRALGDLSSCRVFDSSYSNNILQQHPLDEVLIFPMGLSLFQKISDIITKYKEKIDGEILYWSIKKPVINDKHFSDDTRRFFAKEYFTPLEKDEFRRSLTFSQNEQSRLDDLSLRLENLRKGDWVSKKKLLETYIAKIIYFIECIRNWSKKIAEHEKQVIDIISNYNAKKSANDKQKEKIAIISKIPGTSSPAWKDFIRSGLTYNNEFGSNTDCPYCRQKLGADAIQVINAYVCFLNDRSASDLQKTEQALNELYSAINSYNFDLLKSSCDDACSTLSGQETFSESMRLDCYKFVEECRSFKTALLQALQNKIIPSDFVRINIESTIAFMNSIVNKFRDDIKQIENDEKDNEKLVAIVSAEIMVLQEKKSLFSQVSAIEKLFEVTDRIHALSLREKKLSTRLITDKANQASQDLLTEALRDRFNDELKNLGFINFYVKLERGSAKKGVPTSKLSLLNNGELSAVLSEGEQKAVSLALFLAESRTQEVSAPIILDDPVNSLDHKIARGLANRLMSMENQVIIFTHNKLFMDAFESSGGLAHICKNTSGGCNSKGKHIFAYCVESEARCSKGAIVPFRGHRASNHIDSANAALCKTPFDDAEKVAANLRLAVECIIDEVIFNNLSPTKYSCKKDHIDWDGLKKLTTNHKLVDLLHGIHDRVSGGVLHTGYESDYNGISLEEFKKMVSDLENIMPT